VKVKVKVKVVREEVREGRKEMIDNLHPPI
jgi:hypothetical protein